MYTALHTYSFREKIKADPSFDVFKMLAWCAENGFSAIEIMTGQAGSPPTDISGDSPGHLAEVRKRAEALGIRIDCLSTYNDFSFTPNESWRLANIQYIKDWLVRAGDMGVPNIRMLTGYLVAGEPADKLEKLVKAGIAECVPIAEKAGVNMAIENHNSIFKSAADIVKLIDEFGSERLTTCPDPTNWNHSTFWNGTIAPESDRREMLDGVKRMAPRATQSHLKIKGVTESGELLGYGPDLIELLRVYQRSGYRGGLAFESIADGDLLAPLPRAKAIVDSALREYSNPA